MKVIAPKEEGAGKIEVKIDGKSSAVVDLSTSGPGLAQQTVCDIKGLRPGKHSISVVNLGPVAIDAVVPG